MDEQAEWVRRTWRWRRTPIVHPVERQAGTSTERSCGCAVVRLKVRETDGVERNREIEGGREIESRGRLRGRERENERY